MGADRTDILVDKDHLSILEIEQRELYNDYISYMNEKAYEERMRIDPHGVQIEKLLDINMG